MPNELRDSVQASVNDAKARVIELQTIITEGEALLIKFPPEGPPPPPPAAPVIVSFTAVPNTGAPGVAVTLAWTVTGATTVTIDQGVGAVAATGTKVVTPGATLAYKLTATNASGSVNKTQTVTVTAVAPPPSPGTFLCDEGGKFTLTTAATVRFRSKKNPGTLFVDVARAAGTHGCNNFEIAGGDPAPGEAKECVLATAAPPPPPGAPAIVTFTATPNTGS